MALSNLFTLFSEKMNYLTQRQAVIGQNIANANTPDYKPKDLESFDKVFAQVQTRGAVSGGIQMAATQPGHLGGSTSGLNSYKSKKPSEYYEVKPSGNAVVLEQQMTQLAESTSQYQMITGLYRKTLSLLKTAMGKGGA